MNKLNGNNNGNRTRRKCTSKAQAFMIKKTYAERAAKQKQQRIEAPYPHFRYYNKSKHPALIVGEQKSEKDVDEYKYRKVMHGDKDGKRTNEKVYPNPDPNDPDPMYIGKRVRHDDKNNFEPRPLPWKYPPNGPHKPNKPKKGK